MDKAFIVQDLANKLFASELSIDAAMADTSTLIAGLVAARRELRVSAEVTDAATAKLAEAVAALAAARSAVVAAHGEMAEAKLRIGIRTKLVGVWDKTRRGSLETVQSDERLAG